MYLDQVMWDSEGWPYINGNTPSQEWDLPWIEGQTPDRTYSRVEYVEFTGASDNYKYFFDTGYVPQKSTRREIDCYSYTEGAAGDPFVDNVWRAICSGRNSNSDGISIYVNPEGDKFGYFVGGYVNDGIAPHEFETRYQIAAQLSDFSVNGDKYYTNRSNYMKNTNRLTIFSGQQDYPYYGRIYGVKVYAPSSRLLHEYLPCVRNEDDMPMLYDTVSQTYIRPHDDAGFGVGPVVDDIKEVGSDALSSGRLLFDIQGRAVRQTPHRGVYIRDGRKVIL